MRMSVHLSLANKGTPAQAKAKASCFLPRSTSAMRLQSPCIQALLLGRPEKRNRRRQCFPLRLETPRREEQVPGQTRSMREKTKTRFVGQQARILKLLDLYCRKYPVVAEDRLPRRQTGLPRRQAGLAAEAVLLAATGVEAGAPPEVVVRQAERAEAVAPD